MCRQINKAIIDGMIRRPEAWEFTACRILEGPGIRIVKSVIDDRWTFVLGEQLGYIKLSMLSHCIIETARVYRKRYDK